MTTRFMVKASLFICLFFISSNLIPPLQILGVPFTLQTLIILLIPFFFKFKQIIVWFSLFISMIFIGIPLMANFNAGLGVLIGPSAGFIFGWLPKMLMIKLLIKANCNKFRMFIVMIIATIVDLVFGSIWLMIYSNTSLLSTFSTTMISFLPFGILKVLLAMIILKKIPIRILN